MTAAILFSTSARVKRVAGEQSKDVEKWIRDISDLHRSKPNPTVHYNKTMPEIDSLMQVFYIFLKGTVQRLGSRFK